MKITVTQEDIDNGEPGSRSCPIANAINRQYTFKKRHPNAIVGLSEVGIDICNSRVWFNLSKPAQKFIKDFDNGLIIKPSTFIITKK